MNPYKLDISELVWFALMVLAIAISPRIAHTDWRFIAIMGAAVTGVLFFRWILLAGHRFSSAKSLARANSFMLAINGMIWVTFGLISFFAWMVNQARNEDVLPFESNLAMFSLAFVIALPTMGGITFFQDWLQRPVVDKTVLQILVEHDHEMLQGDVVAEAAPLSMYRVRDSLDQFAKDGFLSARQSKTTCPCGRTYTYFSLTDKGFNQRNLLWHDPIRC